METNEIPVAPAKERLRKLITVLNIIFGLGILICPITLFIAAFSDTQDSLATGRFLLGWTVAYPIVTIICIIVSRIRRSVIWALLPLVIPFILAPIISAIFNF